FVLSPRPPSSTLFPYTTLFRSSKSLPWSKSPSKGTTVAPREEVPTYTPMERAEGSDAASIIGAEIAFQTRPVFSRRLQRFVRHLDRKSTRLNSSHVSISYAVFC